MKLSLAFTRQFLLIAAFLLSIANSINAQALDSREFDARLLTAAEKRILQAALVVTGDYNALLDGAWGNGSQRALERYTQREFATDKPHFSHLSNLLNTWQAEQYASGWDEVYFESTQLSILLPIGILSDLDSEDKILRFDTEDSGLVVLIDFADLPQILEFHRYIRNAHIGPDVAYINDKRERYVTSARTDRFQSTYSRSDHVGNGYFTTVTIIANDQYKKHISLIASSLQRHPGSSLDVASSRILNNIANAGYSPPSNPSGSQGRVRDGPVTTEPLQLKGTGTGFFINNTDLVTAAHVVEGCMLLELPNSAKLTLLYSDSDSDLAVLSSSQRAEEWLAISEDVMPNLGESVFALGYPYFSLLGQGLTVSGGNVSSLRGVGGDTNRLMFSAPIQPGNSGGPLLNQSGYVVGVVVSQLDDMMILENTGGLPQNMNFAATPANLVSFLNTANVLYPKSNSTAIPASGAVPVNIQNAVVPIICKG